MPSSIIKYIPVISVIIAVLSLTLTFTFQYVGNEKVKAAIDQLTTWIKVKIIKRYRFPVSYLTILILALVALSRNDLFESQYILLAYDLWITPLALYFFKRHRTVSTTAYCQIDGKDNLNGYNGLIYVRHTDGDAVKEIFNEINTLRTDFKSGNYYIYFKIKDEVLLNMRKAPCAILVEYFDAVGTGAFDIQYDSKDGKIPEPRYKPTYPWAYTGTKTWKMASFRIPDPSFTHLQNAQADFRLRLDPRVRRNNVYTDLRIRSVACVSLPH